MRQKASTVNGQRDVAGLPLEQTSAELALELGDSLGHRLLTYTQHRRSQTELTLIGNSDHRA